MNAEFRKCPYCEKLNPADQPRCSWCNSCLPTRAGRIVNIVLVVTALLATASLIWFYST